MQLKVLLLRNRLRRGLLYLLLALCQLLQLLMLLQVLLMLLQVLLMLSLLVLMLQHGLLIWLRPRGINAGQLIHDNVILGVPLARAFLRSSLAWCSSDGNGALPHKLPQP